MSQPTSVPYASREAFAAALRDFINRDLPRLHSKVKESPNVGLGTPLFSSGIIDSMAILHLIGFVESATGRGIPHEKVVMKHFQTITAIAESFWEPPTSP